MSLPMLFLFLHNFCSHEMHSTESWLVLLLPHCDLLSNTFRVVTAPFTAEIWPYNLLVFIFSYFLKTLVKRVNNFIICISLSPSPMFWNKRLLLKCSLWSLGDLPAKLEEGEGVKGTQAKGQGERGLRARAQSQEAGGLWAFMPVPILVQGEQLTTSQETAHLIMKKLRILSRDVSM